MSGIAKSTITITDSSVVNTTGAKGICAVLGATERGRVNQPVLVSSWFEYQREFGGLISTSDFPLYCKRALDGGAKLYVNRVAHYSDITDTATITGAKATSTTLFRAKNIGTWGNGLSVLVTVNALNAAKIDIKVTLSGYPSLTQTITGITAILTADDIARFNASNYFVDIIAAAATELDADTYTFSSGTNTGTIVNADFIGSAETSTGFYAFDNITDAWYIAAPEKAVNAIDLALVAYADARGDLRPILRTPVGLTKAGILDYRNATGSYSGTAVDSWRAVMFTGGLKITHPTTNATVEISEIADVIARISTKDNTGNSWNAFSGPANGKIPNTIGVVINFGSPALESDASQIVNIGVNPVINHPTFRTVIWGNRSLLLDTAKMLFFAHVGDIVLYLQRFLKPVIGAVLFTPNDVDTWRGLYNSIQPELENLVAQRAIRKYEYYGDQFVDKYENVTVNNVADLDAGKYVVIIRIYPTSKLEYLDVKLDIINGAVSLDVQN